MMVHDKENTPSQDTIEFWRDIGKMKKTPEDYGYIALFIAIFRNKSSKDALIDLKGQADEES